MKVINSEEELKEFNKYLLDNPYSPNKVKYNGNEYVIIFGKAILVRDNKNIVEDHYHPGCWINEYVQIYYIYNILSIGRPNPKLAYHPKNPDSWIHVAYDRVINGQKYIVTSDVELYQQKTQKVITKAHSELKPIQHTDAEMESFGFVKGVINSSYWFHKDEIKDLDTMLPYKKFENVHYKVNLERYEQDLKSQGHTCEDISRLVAQSRKENILFGVDSATYKGFEGIRYTFGVEIETCIGRLEPEDYKFLNVKAVHDGSLRDENGQTPGGEFVTGILTGDSGLTQLAELCRILALKCKLNEKCGVHVHCGNLDWNKEDICFSYILAEQLEDELFSMLPKSRRSNSYCRRLTQLTLGYLPELRETRSKSQYDILIDRIYADVFKEVTYTKGKNKALSFNEDGTKSVSESNKNMNRNTQHPDGAKCGYDKNAQRYCWLNFVTLLYNTKGLNGSNTLELRSHSATMNFNKIKNWIKLFFAICKFVENNKTQIKEGKVTLAQVITAAYPQTGDKLIQYVEERKQLFKSHDESVDYVEIAPKKRTIKEIVEVS